MKTQNYTLDFAKRFKLSYTYKMGGTQTVVMPNGQRFAFNDKEYYSGRGSKYNSSINHHNIGDVVVSQKSVNEALKQALERTKNQKLADKKAKVKAKRIELAKIQGIYNIITSDNDMYVELSNEESEGKYFDIDRLSFTLKISRDDAALVAANGKTYVFARSEDGNLYELYHSSLDCNLLCISVQKVTENEVEDFAKKWGEHGRFAFILGQTENKNQFVC